MLKEKNEIFLRKNWLIISRIEIARQLKMTYDELIEYADKLKLINKNSIDEKRKHYIYLNQRKTCKEIMTTLHITYKKYKEFREEIGIQVKSPCSVTTDLIEFIRDNYEKEEYSAKKISEIFNCGESTVYKYARILEKTTKKRMWIDEEDEVIIEYSGSTNISKVQAELKKKGYNRTKDAIIDRKKKHKIKSDITDNGYYLKTTELTELIGCSQSTLNRWIHKKYIKAEKVKGNYRFTIEDIQSFMYNNPSRWNFTKLDIEAFEILCVSSKYRNNNKPFCKQHWYLSKKENELKQQLKSKIEIY